MKNYELIEKMSRAVYEASNSRKVLKETKKYLKANGYNVYWDKDTEILDVCPGDKSIVADWNYVVTIIYRADYGYRIGTANNGWCFMDGYSGVVMLDMMKLANKVMDMINTNTCLVDIQKDEGKEK